MQRNEIFGQVAMRLPARQCQQMFQEDPQNMKSIPAPVPGGTLGLPLLFTVVQPLGV